MKKIISIISALTLGVCAFAITPAELGAELTAELDAGTPEWKAAINVYRTHADEVPTAFNSWKSSDWAKTCFADKGYAELAATISAEEAQNINSARKVFCQYLLANPQLIATTPLRVALITAPQKAMPIISEDNPTQYAELKEANWIVDGVALPAFARYNIAQSMGDTEWIIAQPIADGMQAPDVYLKYFLPTLLDASDVSAAKSALRELENWYLKRGIYSNSYLTQIQSVNKALTARLVDQKIMGK